MTSQILKGHRISFRAVEPEDADLLLECENDSSAWWTSDTLSPFSAHQIRQYALTSSNDPFSEGQLRLMAVDSITGCTVAIVDLYDISARHLHAFVGIYVFPRFRHIGIASECLKILWLYSRSTLGLKTIAAKIIDSNTTAISLFSKCGFKKCGVLPSWRRIADSFHSILLFVKTQDQDTVRNLTQQSNTGL
ncbi:MAG: GNAT family N-acetyltransferase [Muribaculum sp.]|nr:GNAT family N-acetyltransferase [Muribaculum sp.]